jgi:hypothetical protein
MSVKEAFTMKSASLSKGLAGLSFDSDQAFRSNEASIRDNKVELSEQPVIFGFNADQRSAPNKNNSSGLRKPCFCRVD